jgi:quinoprotein dehydrogenase-associated probable ABC transporter substrate-binding protein
VESSARHERSRDRSRVGLATLALLTLAFVSPASRPLRAQAAGGQAAAAPAHSAWKDDKVLRVCADPDNIPFTDQTKGGFDNRIAELIAKELGDSISYLWWPARRGFIRNTLRAHECDVVLGVPGDYDPVLPTRPYYRSTYYLAYRSDRKRAITSLDDPALKRLKIGVNLIGDDYAHTPPVHALLARGISANVTGFSSFYGEEHHPGEIMEALARGDVDVAIAWGPLVGYFAKELKLPVTLVPLADDKMSGMPFEFDVVMGVRRADKELRERLNEIIERRRQDIEQILTEYNVPTISRRAAAKPATAKPEAGKPQS